MAGYTPLYASILDSSIWAEDHATRLVWITLLAMVDRDGRVDASVPGLAHRARVTRAEAEHAIERLSSPDLDDRSGVDEGRRIRAVQGGWILVTYAAYRLERDPEARREQNREAKRRSRERQPSQPRSATVSQKSAGSAYADADPTPDGVGGSLREPARAKRSTPKAQKARKWTRVPDGWAPSEAHRALATELGVGIDRELAAFRDHEFGRPKSDADAAFRAWLRRASEYRRGNGQRPRSVVQQGGTIRQGTPAWLDDDEPGGAA